MSAFKGARGVERPHRRRPLLVLGFLAALATAPTASAADATAPGTTFRDCKTCPQMVVVPAGRFVMGRDDGRAEEAPATPVTITRPSRCP